MVSTFSFILMAEIESKEMYEQRIRFRSNETKYT